MPNSIYWPMDWRIKRPDTIKERELKLFEDYDRLYSDDALIIEELQTAILQKEGAITINDAYSRDLAAKKKPHPFMNNNITLPPIQNGRNIIHEGTGVIGVIGPKLISTLEAKGADQINFINGIVIVRDLRLAFLAALFRDIDGGRIKNYHELVERATFRVRDICTAYEKRGVKQVIEGAAKGGIGLDSTQCLSDFTGNKLAA